MRVLSMPGLEVTSLQWDAKDERLAVSAGAGVYTAEVQVRPMWCQFSDTLAYAEGADVSSAMRGHDGLPTEVVPCINLLGMLSGDKRALRVPGLLMLAVRCMSAPATT